MLLVLSGLSMFHPMLFWLSDLFGGGQWTRAIHPWIGIVLLRQLRRADRAVLARQSSGAATTSPGWPRSSACSSNDEESVPEVGRFNAGQKFVFWSMALLVPVLFVTGLVIWEVYFARFTTIETAAVAAADPQPGCGRGDHRSGSSMSMRRSGSRARCGR